MNDVINNILTRRSVRDFSDKLVAKEDIETMIMAGLCAPSGMNRQTWKLTGVLNQEIIAKFAKSIEKILSRENYKFYGATAIIITSNAVDNKFGCDDNACALENIFLTAHSLGIDSVWINQFRDICDNEEFRALLSSVGIPENHVVFGVAALGYSGSEAKGIVEKVGEFAIIE